MVFKIRVTLAGIKGFYRLYHINGATTLYNIHKQLRSDLEFAQDQIIMFKALDVTGGVVARYGLFDLGSGTVDRVTLEDTVKAGTDSMVYFYDVTNKKSVILTVEGEAEGERVTGLVLKDLDLPQSGQDFGEKCSLVTRVRLAQDESFKERLLGIAELKEI